MLLKRIFHRCLRSRWYSTSSNEYANVSFENGVKRITMSHAKTRNSLSIAMMQNLIAHISSDWNDVQLRAVVIFGSGHIFSAGHNLKELSKEAGVASQQKVFATAAELMQAIVECPVPVIAGVQGLAAAAGCQLVAQADLAVCTRESQFSTPGINLGLFCSTPGVALARSVPKATALKMLLTGMPITSDEALAVGLVSHVCDANQLDATVSQLCTIINEKSRSVVELGKRFFYKQIAEERRHAYHHGGDAMVRNLQLQDGVEGIQSFIEKRPPRWSHK